MDVSSEIQTKISQATRVIGVVGACGNALSMLVQCRKSVELGEAGWAYEDARTIGFSHHVLIDAKKVTSNGIHLGDGDVGVTVARFDVEQDCCKTSEGSGTTEAAKSPGPMRHTMLRSISKGSRQRGKNQKLTAWKSSTRRKCIPHTPQVLWA